MNEQARALLVANLDVDLSVASDNDFNDWYSNEHIPERLACPGFLEAVRFFRVPDPSAPDAVSKLARYLAVYELASVDALRTPEYLKLKGAGSPRTEQMRKAMINLGRGVFERMEPGGVDY
jgi:hypothetical protein